MTTVTALTTLNGMPSSEKNPLLCISAHTHTSILYETHTNAQHTCTDNRVNTVCHTFPLSLFCQRSRTHFFSCSHSHSLQMSINVNFDEFDSKDVCVCVFYSLGYCYIGALHIQHRDACLYHFAAVVGAASAVAIVVVAGAIAIYFPIYLRFRLQVHPKCSEK